LRAEPNSSQRRCLPERGQEAGTARISILDALDIPGYRLLSQAAVRAENSRGGERGKRGKAKRMTGKLDLSEVTLCIADCVAAAA